MRNGDAYTVHLPRGFSQRRVERWPVILILHGAGRNRRTLWEHPQSRAALEASRCVIVMPDGKNSWWLGRYATYPLELLDWLTPRLHLASSGARPDGIGRDGTGWNGAGWGVAGWSMGGFGSLRLLQQHPDRFAAWGGLLALTDFPNPALPADQNHSVPPLFGDETAWPLLNPMRHAETLRGKAVFLLTATEAFDRTMNRNFHRRLNQLGIAHEYVEVPGGHKYDIVAANLSRLIEYLERTLTKGQP
jgi:S-formylglutathione hydrolase FrmB